ncbi:MAG: site-specific DNA-methyltransferase [Candidatus Aenigmarchaeota archaeon]|nr:site-specific DNA-methyltransferase [Candidatus Aenigmarchaeota archaeon]
MEIQLHGKKIRYSEDFKEGFDTAIIHNDVLSVLNTLPNESVALIVTSPPYNIGKPYESPLEFQDYLRWQTAVLQECVRILKPNGSICWEVGNYVSDGEVFPLDVYFYTIMKGLHLKMRNRIVWHFRHGLHASKRFSGRYETILWFTKGDRYVFNLDAVRVPQKYPGKLGYKGDSKGRPTGNPRGMNPSDKWEIVLRDWENELWDIPNVKSNHPEKTIHPCQFPIELIERLVLALTNEGDVIFDPFVGVGSSLVAGLEQNRKSVGVDKEKNYTDIAFARVTEAINGKLKRREFGKPVHQPKGNEKILRVPEEWKTAKLSKWVQ